MSWSTAFGDDDDNRDDDDEGDCYYSDKNDFNVCFMIHGSCSMLHYSGLWFMVDCLWLMFYSILDL